jgi:hypothetical protein
MPVREKRPIKRYIPGDTEVAVRVASSEGWTEGQEQSFAFEGRRRTIVYSAKYWLRTEGPGYEYGQEKEAKAALTRHLKRQLGILPSLLFSVFIRLIVNFLIDRYFEPVENTP